MLTKHRRQCVETVSRTQCGMAVEPRNDEWRTAQTFLSRIFIAFNTKTPGLQVHSGGLSIQVQQFFIHDLIRSFPAETFSWTVVQQVRHLIQILLSHTQEAGVLWKELSKKTIGIFVGWSFPWAVRVRDVDWGFYPGCHFLMGSKLLAIVHGQCMARKIFQSIANSLCQRFVSECLLSSFRAIRSRVFLSTKVRMCPVRHFPATVSPSQSPARHLDCASSGL